MRHSLSSHYVVRLEHRTGDPVRRADARSGVSFRERLVSPVKRRSGAPRHPANSAHDLASNSASLGLRSVCRSKHLRRLARKLASRDTRSRYARSHRRDRPDTISWSVSGAQREEARKICAWSRQEKRADEQVFYRQPRSERSSIQTELRVDSCAERTRKLMVCGPSALARPDPIAVAH